MAGAVALASAAHADVYSGYDRDTAYYLVTLHSDNEPSLDRDLSTFSDAFLIREGHLACNGLAAGWMHRQVWAGIRRDMGLPYSTMADAAITGSAISTWCPQYSNNPPPQPPQPPVV